MSGQKLRHKHDLTAEEIEIIQRLARSNRYNDAIHAFAGKQLS